MKLNIFNARKMLAGLVCAVGFFSSFSGNAQQRTLYRPADSVSLGGKSLAAVLFVPTGGSGGTGLTGILKPLAGKTISCSAPYGIFSGTYTFYAYVDPNGNPFARVRVFGDMNFGTQDSGWVSGFYVNTSYGDVNWNTLTIVGSTWNGSGCSVMWPLT